MQDEKSFRSVSLEKPLAQAALGSVREAKGGKRINKKKVDFGIGEQFWISLRLVYTLKYKYKKLKWIDNNQKSKQLLTQSFIPPYLKNLHAQ